MEAIQSIRQMMADQKFFEAQKLIEAQLSLSADNRHELLGLLLEALSQQKKEIPKGLLVDLAEKESDQKNFERALELLIDVNSPEHQTRVLKVKLQAAEARGQISLLYDLISENLLSQFAKQIPHIPVWCGAVIDKYFKHDFNIQLKLLAIELLVNNLERAEELLQELIISSVERSSPKGLNDRFYAINEVLNASVKGHLEIYKNFCAIYSMGVDEKSEYKRIIEMIIYFDDFRLQAMVLKILDQAGLKNEAVEYALAIKQNKEYSYVYFDKYFPHLKSYFFKPIPKTEAKQTKEEIPDLKLTEKYRSPLLGEIEQEIESDEFVSYINLLKHQDYSVAQLCDLAVSFLQSEMPKVALKAAERAIELSRSSEEFLKAAYLRVSSLFLLKDFRAALDTCLMALDRAQTTDDVLSFMYAQAEAYIRLGQNKNAKSVLKRILQIDARYRLARERLEKLNEI